MARLGNAPIPLLTTTIVEQLRAKKIFTVVDLIAETTEKLMRITGLSYKDILDVREEILRHNGGIFKNAVELLDMQRRFMATGIPSLDTLLDGGLRIGRIYEFCGLSSAGKTAIALGISTNVALNFNCDVHYIDTKRDFSASRIQMILEERKISDEEILRVMEQIRLSKIQSLSDLFSSLYSLSSYRADQQRLIIIDSLPPLFNISHDNCDSQYSLNHLGNICRFLANERGFSIITINSVTQWRTTEGFASISAEESTVVKPLLGRDWRRIPNTRIFVEALPNEKRKLSLWKSHELPMDKSVEIKIGNSGIL